MLVAAGCRSLASYANSSFYFSFTNSKTKIAQTPTVMGNWAACACCKAPPRGIAKERQNIATAVSIPRNNLLFQLIVVFPSPSGFAHVPVELRQSCSGGSGHSTLEAGCSVILRLFPRRPSLPIVWESITHQFSFGFPPAPTGLSFGQCEVCKQSLNNKVTTERHPKWSRRCPTICKSLQFAGWRKLCG